MATPPGRELGDLADELDDWARAVPFTSDRLLEVSAGRLVQPRSSFRDFLVIKHVIFDFRFYLAKEKEKIRFFHSRREAPELVFDTSVNLGLSPSRVPQVVGAPADFRLAVPPFLLSRPSASQIARYGPPGSTLENSVFLRVGSAMKSILALKFTGGPFDSASIRYTAGGKALDIGPAEGRWPVAPFLDFVSAIRHWVSRERRGEEMRAFPPPTEAEPSEPRRILFELVRGYRAVNQGVATPRPELPAALGRLSTEYEVSSFGADILLRLKPDGTLATTDDDDPFQLLMRIDVTREPENERVVVSLKPPDFLVSGALHQTFIDAVIEDDGGEVEAALGLSPPRAREFLRTYGSDATIFRTRRHFLRDTDVIVIPGGISGNRVVLIMSGRFRVDTRAKDRVFLIPGTLDVLFAGPLDGDVSALDRRTAEYFIRLAAAIKDWAGVLP